MVRRKKRRRNPGEASFDRVLLSPLATRLVESGRVDLSAIVGTGEDGVITEEDVLAAAGPLDDEFFEEMAEEDESAFDGSSETGGSVDSVFQVETTSPSVVLISPWEGNPLTRPEPELGDPYGPPTPAESDDAPDETEDTMENPEGTDEDSAPAVSEPMSVEDEFVAEVEDVGEVADLGEEVPVAEGGDEAAEDFAAAEDEAFVDDEAAEVEDVGAMAELGDMSRDVTDDGPAPEDESPDQQRDTSDESQNGEMPVSTQEKLQETIASIHEAIPDLNGVMVASKEGFPIAHDFAPEESDRLAAMAATALGLGRRITETAGLGGFEEAVVWGTAGCLLVLAAGDGGVLALGMPSGTNLGLVRIEARNAVGVVAGLL